MDYPEEATAALLAGAMAAGNMGADWGAAAAGVPAYVHPRIHEKKGKEKTTPFSINLMRSTV